MSKPLIPLYTPFHNGAMLADLRSNLIHAHPGQQTAPLRANTCIDLIAVSTAPTQPAVTERIGRDVKLDSLVIELMDSDVRFELTNSDIALKPALTGNVRDIYVDLSEHQFKLDGETKFLTPTSDYAAKSQRYLTSCLMGGLQFSLMFPDLWLQINTETGLCRLNQTHPVVALASQKVGPTEDLLAMVNNASVIGYTLSVNLGDDPVQEVVPREDEMISVCLLMDHVIEPQDALLQIRVKDEPGPGNANRHYEFYIEPNQGNERGYKTEIHFQGGSIAEHGLNGITNEALLAVVIDRLRGFQKGSFPCEENAQALVNAKQSLHWLQQRTIKLRRLRSPYRSHKPVA